MGLQQKLCPRLPELEKTDPVSLLMIRNVSFDTENKETPMKQRNQGLKFSVSFVGALAIGCGISVPAAAQAAATSAALNDTGVTFGADSTHGNYAACTGAEVDQQDCATGRDALAQAGQLVKVGAGPAGFDFSRVCNSGELAGVAACPTLPALGPGANDWACTRDNATGLTWEIKTAEAGPRQRDNTFTQFSAAYNPSREMGSDNDAAGYLNAINAQRLCGATDWRVPSRLELLGIVHYGSAPTANAIAAAQFPNPPSKLNKSVFWSGSAAAGTPANAWGVDFADGSAGDDNRSVYYALRLVRGAPLAGVEWRVAADGQEVKDSRSNLVWRRCAEGMAWTGSTCTGTAGTFTWAEALLHAKATAKSVAWRLPNIKELSSLVDDGRANPSIAVAGFPATPAAWFWSSTPDASDAAYTWYVNFGTGYTGHHGFRTDRHALRLVRSGP